MSRLRDRVAKVVAVAEADAAEVDRLGRFPHRAIDLMREVGLLGAYVPSAHGGLDASLRELASVCADLARACASTGMIFAMHQAQAACLVRHMPERADVLTELAKGRLLLASSTTEAQTGGDLGRSACAVETCGDRFTLTKSATVISYGQEADALLVTARRSPDAAATDQVLVLLNARDYQLERVGDWDAMGMRGTCSHAFELKAAAPVDQVLAPPLHAISAETMVVAAHTLWSAVWFGIATGACEATRRRLRRSPEGRRPGCDVGQEFGRMLAGVQISRDAIAAAADEFDRTPLGSGAATLPFRANLLKVAVSEATVRVVQRALLVCGLSGYRNQGEGSLARHLRDIHSAPIMINDLRVLSSVHAHGLLVEVERWSL